MASLGERARGYTATRRMRARILVIFLLLSVIVALGVERALRHPGVSMTASTSVLDCPYQAETSLAHTHNADCYNSDGTLVCPLPEQPLHQHDETCYAEDGTLICGMDELYEEHIHGPECFREEQAPVALLLRQTIETSDQQYLTVTLDAPEEAGLTPNVELQVTEIVQGSDEWLFYEQQALETLAADEVTLARFVDISLVRDGEPIQPNADVTVSIETTDAIVSMDNAEPSVVHFDETNPYEPETVDSTTDGEVTCFQTQSFSVYGMVYTVDFTYESLTYALPGGGDLLLSELFDALGIQASVQDVDKVEFSDPSVLSVYEAQGGETVMRIVPDESAQETGSLVPEGPLVEELLDEALPSPFTEVAVEPGDYILTSLASFDTAEMLTVQAGSTLYQITVTDPLSPDQIGPKPWRLEDVATISLSYDTAYTTQDQDRNATLSLGFTYDMSREMVAQLKRSFNMWSAWFGDYPTFTYDIREALQGSDLANTIQAGTSWLQSGRKRVAKLTVGSDGIITLQITDLNWFFGRMSIDGTFSLDLSLDASEAAGHTGTTIQLPGVDPLRITYKTDIDANAKTVTATPHADGSYTLNYTAGITTEALSSLQYVDAFSGLQQLQEDSVTVNGTSVTVSPTGNGFTYDFPTTSEGTVAAGTYTIAYATTVSAEAYAALAEGASSWETNQASWTYNGDHTLDGGKTSYEIAKPTVDPPTIRKSSTANGTVNPDGTITYTLSLEGERLAGLTITDNMTDLQYLTGTPSVKVDGQDRADLVQGMFSTYYANRDDRYTTYDTAVINYTFPSDFAGTNVVVSYTTKVIDQDVASANGIYGKQTVANALSENWTWQRATTSATTEFEKETETKVTKSAEDDGTGTITYTIVIGDGSTVLDGVKVTDVMSGNHQWLHDTFAMTGSNVDFSWAPTYDNNATAWNQTALNFTFPAGTGKGPVTITYQARTFADDEAQAASIYGAQTLSNTVDAGTGHDTTSVPHAYPDEETFPVRKEASTEEPAPGDSVSYTVVFGDENTSVDSSLRILDEMTDIQKLSSDVTVTLPNTSANGTGTLSNGTVVTLRNGTFTMPKAANGWDTTGVTWGYFDDDSYSTYGTARTFNFQFPDFCDASGTKLALTGPVTVSYDATIISADEAANANITGQQTASNTASSGNGSATTTVTTTFASDLSHDATLSKEFLSWDDDGYATWWAMRIKAAEGSSYPLTDLTLTEDWASGSIYYSTDYPVQNYQKNALAHLDLLGAQVVTDSGTILQAGRDYAIDRAAGSFSFAQLNEPVTIRLAIRNPDATINTFYQHNQATLRWKKDRYNTGSMTKDATCKRIKQEVDLTKSGTYDEATRTITWKVVFNPYLKEVAPEWPTVRFQDTLPTGLAYVDGSFEVAISGSAWANHNPTPTVTGSKLVVDDISLHTMWGSNINRTVDGVAGVGTGLSGTCYTVTYQTKVTDAEWNRVTSSLTGTETYQNEVAMTGGEDTTFVASNKVTIEPGNYLKKHDDTPMWHDQYILDVDEDGRIMGFDADGEELREYTLEEANNIETVEELDNLGLTGNQLRYRIDVNSDQNVLNSGKTLTLSDRINTNMELVTASVRVRVHAKGAVTTLSTEDLAQQGISISYNDDTRYLAISGLKDQTHYEVTYLTTVRSYQQDTFTNTATLIGGGSHSDRVSAQHAAYRSTQGIQGQILNYLSLKKIDENDITKTLAGASFKLYECTLATDVSDYTPEDWLDLLNDVDSGDEAIIAGIKQKYAIVNEEDVTAQHAVLGSYEDMIDGGGADVGPNGITTDDRGIVTFKELEEHTLYYWVETVAPDGYTVPTSGKHYFVLYANEDLTDLQDNILMTVEERKKAAWALDDACQYANDVTIASMSSETVWNATNHDDYYTSITATKVWEGDYDNTYETRPATGIQFDLYRVDSNGNKTLVEDRSPVPINVNSDGYWESYTWYRLSSAYSYTVVEHPVPGYVTTYSDDQEGVEAGTITITNTYVPKNTEIYVQKQWEPAQGAKPDQVMVKLYQVAHIVSDDGTVTTKVSYTGQQLALTAGNGWKDGWTDLPTTDDDGNTLTYTVVEDVDAVNKATGMAYGAVYSDEGAGVVSAPEDRPLVITNVKDADGSLRITKKVTVNGESVIDTAADGTYRFRVTDAQGNPAVHTDGTAVGAVEVEVTNGKAQSVMVDHLKAGTYYVSEYAPTNGTTLVSPNNVKVTVVAGVTQEDRVDTATFTNNIDKTRVHVTKRWVNASNVNAWPSGATLDVILMKESPNGARSIVQRPAAYEGDNSWSATQTLSAKAESYLWDNLDPLKEGERYLVSEKGTGTTYITLDGVTYHAMSKVEQSTNGLLTEITLFNTQVTDVMFTKQWGADGTGEWPQGATVTVQLYKDGVAEDEPVTLSYGTSDANVVPRLVGDGYTYTWKNLDANHTYTVRETSTPAGYLPQQIDDLTIRNVPLKQSITVRKAWTQADGSTSWPADVSKVTLALMRRKARAFVDGSWTDLTDTAYEDTGTTLTVTPSSNPLSYEVDAYALEGDVLYEYAYTVREQAVPVGYQAVYAGAGTQDIAVTNVENTEGRMSVQMRKRFWSQAEGRFLAASEVPEDFATTFTLKRYAATGGDAPSTEPSSGGNDVIIDFTSSNNPYGRHATLTSSAAFGERVSFAFDGITYGHWVNGQYVDYLDESIITLFLSSGGNQYNYYMGGQKLDFEYSRQGDVVTIAFTVPAEDYAWSVDTATGEKICRVTVSVATGDDGTFSDVNTTIHSSGSTTPPAEDTSYVGPTLSFPADGTWDEEDGEPVWQGSFGSVPTEEDGTTYSYYVVEGDLPEGYSVEYTDVTEENRLSATGVANITNTVPVPAPEPETTSVVVDKVWTDGTAKHVQDTATIELYKVRSRAEVPDEPTSLTMVADPALTSGTVTLTVSDGTTTQTFTLDSGHQSHVVENLDKSKTYTVAVADFDTTVFDTATVDGGSTATVSGATGGTVTIATTPASGGGTAGELDAPGAGVVSLSLVVDDQVAHDGYNIALFNIGTATQYTWNGQWGNDWQINTSFPSLNKDNLLSEQTIADTTHDYYIINFTASNFEHLYFRSSTEIVAKGFEGDDAGNMSSWIVVRGSADGIAFQFGTTPFESALTSAASTRGPLRSLLAMGSTQAATPNPLFADAPGLALTAASTSEPQEMTPAEQTGLHLPQGAILLEDQTVTLNAGSDGTWSHTWDKLPTTEVVDGIAYDLAYYVKESQVATTAHSVASSYSYVYNTAGDATSGVRQVTVVNRPTYTGGLKIAKTWAGLPAGADVSDLTFHITGPDFECDVTYADFDENGEYVIAETGLPVDAVFQVSETNAAGLVDGYTLVEGQSTTAASGSVPAEGVGVINLTNTYREVLGTITVTKDVLLNGDQRYDDVAAGQRFRIGLERKVNGAWEVVTDPEDETGSRPWTKQVPIGSGSTGTMTFADLPLGIYRAYEVADDGSRIAATSGDDTATVNDTAWHVTQEGTSYVLNTGDGTLEMQAGSEVTLSAGSETQKAPRNAEIVLSNNKTETGSITITKTLLYNGSVDTTAMDADSWYAHATNGTGVSKREVRVGLYADAKAQTPVRDPQSGELWTQTITFVDESGADVGKGSVTFDDLPFGTYYVFELDDQGDAVTGTSGTFFGLTYTVSASHKAQVVSHETAHMQLSFTNSYKEQGTIRVSKLVANPDGTADTSQAGSTFKVGLFTLRDQGAPLSNPDSYRLVNGRIQTLQVDAQGTGEATFERLDFDATGTTYYVFELNDNLEPVISGTVGNGYTVLYENAGSEHPFTLTPSQHVFDDSQGGAPGARLTNVADPTSVRIVKVDLQSPTTPLAGAAFTLHRLDENDADMVSYQAGYEPRVSRATDENGVTVIDGITNGYYEVTETTPPSGYVLSGNRTFYFRALNGTVTFLTREDGVAPAAWSAATTPAAESNVLSFAPASTAAKGAVPATATVGNVKGMVLPSAGGTGGATLALALVALCLAALCARQRLSGALISRRHATPTNEGRRS